ncbi:hypothetical protein WA158_006551 [Blastocystis sp. Blastoise]
MIHSTKLIQKCFARSIVSVKPVIPPLSQPLEGMPVLKPLKQKIAPKVEMTTLENGLRIITKDDFDIVSSVGVALNIGSGQEKRNEYGCTQLLEKMLFKQTEHTSQEQMTKRVNEVGTNCSAFVGRDTFTYTISTPRDKVKDMVSILKECIEEPVFDQESIRNTKDIFTLENQTLYLNKTFDLFISDATFASMYGINSPYGHKLRQSPEILSSISSNTLTSFYKSNISYQNLVFCATGVDHDSFVGYIKENMPKLPNRPYYIPPAKSLLMPGGGYYCEDKETEYVHIGVTFNTGGWDSKDIFTVMLLQTLLGGGSAFSSGGPGKGIFSKLYVNVLCRYSFVESAQCYVTPLPTSGCTSVVIQVPPQYASSGTQIICNEIHKLAFGDISNEELERAKNRSIALQFMNTESRQILCEDMARQGLIYNEYKNDDVVIDSFKKVTKDDIVRLIRSSLSKPVGVSAFGPSVGGSKSCVPPFEQVQQYMKKDNWKI